MNTRHEASLCSTATMRPSIPNGNFGRNSNFIDFDALVYRKMLSARN